ncbi:MAG: hypothetical protein ACHQCH_07820 [Solirubrobacterales bacterium]
MSRHPPFVPLTVLCIAAASLVLAACGGSSTNNAAEKERTSEAKAEARFADFAKCLREHGVNAETLTHPGGGHGLKVSPGSGGRQQFEAAQKACQRYQPEPKKVNLSPQEKVARAEAVEKFAKCMREHGIELHASSSEGSIRIRVPGGPGSGPNPESPSFQKAQQACQGLLPFKGHGPPGAPHTGPGGSGGGNFAIGG